MYAPTRLTGRRLAFAGATVFATLGLRPAIAVAQQQPPSECAKGIDLFKARIGFIQRIQALPKKHADPGAACSLFTGLGGANGRVLTWARANKDWCSIEANQISGLEAEAKQVAGIRAKACNAAAEYNKLKHQAEQAARNQEDSSFGVDMHSDPLAPPVKIPPSAL